MNLTRAARSLLADPRRELTSVLTVMFLVLTVLGVQVLCSVHVAEAGHGTHTHDGVGQHAPLAAADAAGHATPDSHGTEDGSGHHDEDPSDCHEDRTVTARYERMLSPFPDLAEAPDLAQQWLVPAMAHDGPQGPSAGVADAAAPSLHALGISRT